MKQATMLSDLLAVSHGGVATARPRRRASGGPLFRYFLTECDEQCEGVTDFYAPPQYEDQRRWSTSLEQSVDSLRATADSAYVVQLEAADTAMLPVLLSPERAASTSQARDFTIRGKHDTTQTYRVVTSPVQTNGPTATVEMYEGTRRTLRMENTWTHLTDGSWQLGSISVSRYDSSGVVYASSEVIVDSLTQTAVKPSDVRTFLTLAADAVGRGVRGVLVPADALAACESSARGLAISVLGMTVSAALGNPVGVLIGSIGVMNGLHGYARCREDEKLKAAQKKMEVDCKNSAQ